MCVCHGTTLYEPPQGSSSLLLVCMWDEDKGTRGLQRTKRMKEKGKKRERKGREGLSILCDRRSNGIVLREKRWRLRERRWRLREREIEEK